MTERRRCGLSSRSPHRHEQRVFAQDLRHLQPGGLLLHQQVWQFGVGMPITKSIVELMNGTIEVESEKGVGSIFNVTVTLAESERKSAEIEEGELHPHEMCVLVNRRRPRRLRARADRAGAGGRQLRDGGLRHGSPEDGENAPRPAGTL